MRDRVVITLGGREYPLLPTFGVHEQFEDRFGSLMKHYLGLSEFTATLKARSYLVYLAIKADREDRGEDDSMLSWDATAKAMWEQGHAAGELPRKEAELIERLLYTPEQYRAKKEEEAAMKKAAEEMEKAFAFATSSVSPSPV